MSEFTPGICDACGLRTRDRQRIPGGEDADIIYRPRCRCASKTIFRCQCGADVMIPYRCAWCVEGLRIAGHGENSSNEKKASDSPLESNDSASLTCRRCYSDGFAECECEPEPEHAIEGFDLLRIAGPGLAVVLDAQGRPMDIIEDPSPRSPIVHGLVCSDACADAVLAILTAMNAGRCTFPELAEQVLAARARAGGR